MLYDTKSHPQAVALPKVSWYINDQ